MSITSIKINGVLPMVPGMKTLDDFIVTNWFPDFPSVTGSVIGGYYFGSAVNDITLNSFNNAVPAVVNGNLENSAGYIRANQSNYLNTNLKTDGPTKIISVIRRPPAPTGGSCFFVGDFSTSSNVGFALGIGTDGNLRMVAQTAGGALGVSYVSFPGSVAVGDLCVVAGHAYQNQVYSAVYDPDAQNYTGALATLYGTLSAGSLDILIGRRQVGNNASSSVDIKSAVIISGAVTGSEQLAVMKYMLAMQ